MFGIWTFDRLRPEARSPWRTAALVLAVTMAVVAEPVQAGAIGAGLTTGREDLRRRVERIVCTRYHHGMPADSARAVGKRALPVLAELLSNKSKRECWGNAAWAMGLLGDTAYFDTLRAFIWERHRGRIDDVTYNAILSAQGSIGSLASRSTKALEYMFHKTDAAAWRGLPWSTSSDDRHDDAVRLASATVSYLARLDRERLEGFANALRARRRAGDRTATQVDSLTWRNIKEINRQSRVGHAAPKSTTETK